MNYIYKITNLVNNKIYIGQSKDTKQRWRQHKNEAKKDKPKMIINQAMKKYGVDNFTFEVVASCSDMDAANDAETAIVAQENSLVPVGYNVTNGGSNAPKTDAWRKKISEGRMGEKHWMYGKSRSQESNEKTSMSLKGRMPKSIPSRKGIEWTDEEKKKLSDAHKGKNKKFTPEQALEMKHLRETGMSYQKIADYFGCQRNTIYTYLQGASHV